MSFSPDETYDACRREVRTARKEHACGACRCTIHPGDRYLCKSTVYDGTAETFKRCGRCETIHAHLVELGYEHGTYPMERLDCGQTYEDEWGTCPDEIAALAFATEEEAGRLLEKSRG